MDVRVARNSPNNGGAVERRNGPTRMTVSSCAKRMICWSEPNEGRFFRHPSFNPSNPFHPFKSFHQLLWPTPRDNARIARVSREPPLGQAITILVKRWNGWNGFDG